MKSTVVACCSLLALASAGCTVLTTSQQPRILELALRLEKRVDEGERHLVASWAVPSKTKFKNRLLQVSGRIEADQGAQFPAEIVVRAEITNLETGVSLDKVRLIVDRSAENGFRESKKLPKMLAAGSLVSSDIFFSMSPRPAVCLVGRYGPAAWMARMIPAAVSSRTNQ